jgi:predicted SAM-dependent methyltransferase
MAAVTGAAPQETANLNLGCGTFHRAGWLNVDADARVAPDLVLDLDRRPWPWPDGRFERIEMSHVLEHLQSPFETMAELHRVLRPGGHLGIRVPHMSRGFTHPDHKRGFDVSFPLYFDPRQRAFFTGTELTLERMRMRWFAQPALKRQVLPAPLYWLGRSAGAVIDAFANVSPYVCSRGWCFLVGGFEEIEFRFRRPAR